VVPRRSRSTSWGDFAGGSIYLLVGLLAALDEARRSGRGQVVDTAIVDGTAHLMTMIYNVYAAGIWSDERGTNLGDGGTPYYGVYATSDEKHMAVGVLEPKFCAELVRLLGLPPDPAAQSDPPHGHSSRPTSATRAWHPYSVSPMRPSTPTWLPAGLSSRATGSPNRPPHRDSRALPQWWTARHAYPANTPRKNWPTG
jgi:hypothetical protein